MFIGEWSSFLHEALIVFELLYLVSTELIHC